MQYVTNPDGTLDEQTICEEIEHYYDNTPNYYTLKERSPAPSTLFPKPNTLCSSARMVRRQHHPLLHP